MYCPNCGSDNQSEMKFCRRCGTSLEAVSQALAGKAEDRPPKNSQFAKLIKDYHAGRHKMLFGAGSVALGVGLLAILFAFGHWGLFWIFLWVFMGLFGNGVHQFTKGWNRWSEASSELKALGYDRQLANAPTLPGTNSRVIEHSIPADLLSGVPASEMRPPSVTESTTRHLTNKKTK